MHMYFWFGTKLQDFLFQGYNIVDLWGLISTCLGLLALAILFEAMKLLQIKLHLNTKDRNQVPTSIPNTDSSSLISRTSEKSVTQNGSLQCYIQIRWFAEVLHWCIHVTLGYLLMLAVMTYNGYISGAIILGSGIGYYIFGPLLFEVNMQKFQKQRKLVQCNPDCADAPMNTERRESLTSNISEHIEAEINVSVDVDVHVNENG